MSSITHQYDSVTLTTGSGPKGFRLNHGGSEIGVIKRVDTAAGIPQWEVLIYGVDHDRAFASLKAAEFYALATYIEKLTSAAVQEEINKERQAELILRYDGKGRPLTEGEMNELRSLINRPQTETEMEIRRSTEAKLRRF